MMKDYTPPICSSLLVCMKEFETESVHCVKTYCPQTCSMEMYSQAATDPQGHGFRQWKEQDVCYKWKFF